MLKGDEVVKVIRDAEKLEHAVRELELHRALPQHPHVVRCFAGVATHGQVTISLERCAGTLWSSISNEPASAGTFTMPDGAEEPLRHLRRSLSLETADRRPMLATHCTLWSLQGIA